MAWVIPCVYVVVLFIWLVITFAWMGESDPDIFIPILCGFCWPLTLPVALIIYSALGTAWVLEKVGRWLWNHLPKDALEG